MTELTLDLHGKRLDDAIAAVTFYFDRIRSTYAANNPAYAASPNSLKVTVITGSGSHSTHGPVLRSAVQTLLVKRGMNFSIEPGKGAFTVDALSGWDLYASEVPADSKILLSEQQDFHLLASSKKNTVHGASFHQGGCTSLRIGTRFNESPHHLCSTNFGVIFIHTTAVTGNLAPIVKSSRDNGQTSTSDASADPLPKQVALENDAIRFATELSIAQAQKRRAEIKKLQEKQKTELKRALSESQAEYSVYGRCIETEEIEIEKALALSSRDTQEHTLDDAEINDLKLATEQSLLAEQERRQKEEEMFQEELKRALEQSAQTEQIHHINVQNQKNVDLFNVVQISSKEIEAADMSEEVALQTAIQLSQKSYVAKRDDELLNQILQISLKDHQKEEDFKTEAKQQRTVVTDAAWFYIDPQGNVQV